MGRLVRTGRAGPSTALPHARVAREGVGVHAGADPAAAARPRATARRAAWRASRRASAPHGRGAA
eukprot:2517068-Prymnesium_polylepis.1